MKKVLLFIISGGTAALTNLVIYYTLLRVVGVWYLYSSITSFIISVVVGFYLQKYLTFENTSKSETLKQMSMFSLVSLLNLGINVLLMLFFVEITHFDQIFAKVCTLAVLACWNFFVYENFVFKQKISKLP